MTTDADAKIWEERVTAWRASGLSAEKFSADKSFKPHRLWMWSARMRKAQREAAGGSAAGATAAGVRIARVVRTRGAPVISGPDSAPLGLEVSGVRVVVSRGFDRGLLRDVLDELEARGRR